MAEPNKTYDFMRRARWLLLLLLLLLLPLLLLGVGGRLHSKG